MRRKGSTLPGRTGMRNPANDPRSGPANSGSTGQASARRSSHGGGRASIAPIFRAREGARIGPIDLRAEPGVIAHGEDRSLAACAELRAQGDEGAAAVAVRLALHAPARRRATARVLSSPELFRSGAGVEQPRHLAAAVPSVLDLGGECEERLAERRKGRGRAAAHERRVLAAVGERTERLDALVDPDAEPRLPRRRRDEPRLVRVLAAIRRAQHAEALPTPRAARPPRRRRCERPRRARPAPRPPRACTPAPRARPRAPPPRREACPCPPRRPRAAPRRARSAPRARAPRAPPRPPPTRPAHRPPLGPPHPAPSHTHTPTPRARKAGPPAHASWQGSPSRS